MHVAHGTYPLSLDSDVHGEADLDSLLHNDLLTSLLQVYDYLITLTDEVRALVCFVAISR